MLRRMLPLAAMVIGLTGTLVASASVPVVGPTTYTFSAASQSNVWTCNGGQSSFALTVPTGFTGVLTVTVAQTSGGTYVNPPWAYAPGAPGYVNTITNSGSLTVNLGSNQYVKVADTSYTSGSATVSGVCSSAVASIPPQIQTVTAGANVVVSPAPGTVQVAVTEAPTFTGTIAANAPVTNPVLTWLNGTSGSTQISVSGSSVNGIPGYAAFLKQSTGPNLLALDNGGNLGVAGGLFSSGGTLAGATTIKGDTTVDESSVPNNSTLTVQNTNPSNISRIVVNNASTTEAEGASLTLTSGVTNAAPAAAGVIIANDSSMTHPQLGSIFFDTAGASTTDTGGAIVFATKQDGTGTQIENLWMTEGGHVGMPQDVYAEDVTTPASCAALASCATATFTFPNPYVGNTGVAQTPICTGFSVLDASGAPAIWVGSMTAVSSTSVTWSYAPTTATSTARTIQMDFTCHIAAF